MNFHNLSSWNPSVNLYRVLPPIETSTSVPASYLFSRRAPLVFRNLLSRTIWFESSQSVKNKTPPNLNFFPPTGIETDLKWTRSHFFYIDSVWRCSNRLIYRTVYYTVCDLPLILGHWPKRVDPSTWSTTRYQFTCKPIFQRRRPSCLIGRGGFLF